AVRDRFGRCVLGQAAESAGEVETGLQSAELVHQADLGGVAPAPDPAAPEAVDAVRLQATAGGHAVDEAAVDVVHHLLGPGAVGVGEGTVRTGEECALAPHGLRP